MVGIPPSYLEELEGGLVGVWRLIERSKTFERQRLESSNSIKSTSTILALFLVGVVQWLCDVWGLGSTIRLYCSKMVVWIFLCGNAMFRGIITVRRMTVSVFMPVCMCVFPHVYVCIISVEYLAVQVNLVL